MQCPCAILSSVACPPLQYLPTLFENGAIFEKKKRKKKDLLNIKYVLIFSTAFV